MRQISDKHHKSLRHTKGITMGIHLSYKHLVAIVNRWHFAPILALAITLIIALVALPSETALAQSTTANAPNTNSSGAQASESNDGALTREEILAVFQQEARAAYKMNKEACEPLSAEDKKICLARARLQFDADMRYAQKRADQGY